MGMDIDTTPSFVPVTLVKPKLPNLDIELPRRPTNESPIPTPCTSPLLMEISGDSSDSSSNDETGSDTGYQSIDTDSDTDSDTDTESKSDVESGSQDEGGDDDDDETDDDNNPWSKGPSKAYTPPLTPESTTSVDPPKPCKVRCTALAVTVGQQCRRQRIFGYCTHSRRPYSLTHIWQCWQHNGDWIQDKQELLALLAQSPFGPLISPKLPLKAKLALYTKLTNRNARKTIPGTIYVFQKVNPTKPLAPLDADTNDVTVTVYLSSCKGVTERISYWEKKCGYKADVLETFPDEKEVTLCRNAYHVNRLAHIELKPLAAPVKDCQCGADHIKWLALIVPASAIVEITKGAARGWGLDQKLWKISAVRAVIKKWFAYGGVVSNRTSASANASEAANAQIQCKDITQLE
ncbi:hypothetical protein H4R35_001233 [Dimargaris xerosporica]|nr:hypothetical protein H4R35_001233 [Dimargaris xerosporica]